MNRTSKDTRASRGTVYAMLTVVAVFSTALNGCIIPDLLGQRDPPVVQLPTVFESNQPSLDQIIREVNGNSSQIQSFWSNKLRLSGGPIPIGSLTGTIDYDHPRKLRIRAGSMLAPTEIDLGSNQELFWFWARLAPTPGVFYARHNQFASSQIRQHFPFEPDWLIEAMGLTTFRMDERHQGPFDAGDGQLLVRTTRRTSAGPMTKDTTIDAATGVVVAQSLYDCRGSLLGTVYSSQHEQDPFTGLTMPHKITLIIPPAPGSEPSAEPMEMDIHIGDIQVNRPRFTAQNNLYVMPSYGGYRPVDICGPESPIARSMPQQNTVPMTPTGYQTPSRPQPINPQQATPPSYGTRQPGYQYQPPAYVPQQQTSPRLQLPPPPATPSGGRPSELPPQGLPGEHMGYRGTY
jgi:hypothetical protein